VVQGMFPSGYIMKKEAVKDKGRYIHGRWVKVRGLGSRLLFERMGHNTKKGVENEEDS